MGGSGWTGAGRFDLSQVSTVEKKGNSQLIKVDVYSHESILLTDEFGTRLTQYPRVDHKGERIYIVGEPNKPFMIEIERQVDANLEVLISVDGLGYSTMAPASYNDRGIFFMDGEDKIGRFNRYQVGPLLCGYWMFGDTLMGGLMNGYIFSHRPPANRRGIIGIAVFEVIPVRESPILVNRRAIRTDHSGLGRTSTNPIETYTIRYEDRDSMRALGFPIDPAPLGSEELRQREHHAVAFPGNREVT